jgi:glycerol uptake facilitator-like aquaporin
MKTIFRKYLKYITAGAVGVIVAVCSYVFIVEPSYPYLLLDKDSPVIDDATGLGYLPIEMTGASADNAIVKHMCSVPEVYSKYIHNVSNKDSLMSSENEIGKFVLNYSWEIILGLLLILTIYIIYSNHKKRRKTL